MLWSEGYFNILPGTFNCKKYKNLLETVYWLKIMIAPSLTQVWD